MPLRHLVTTALGVVGVAAAATSSSSSCDYDGLVTLAKGGTDDTAVVYAANCATTDVDVDDGVLDVSSLKIEQVASIPADVTELTLDINNISSLSLGSSSKLAKLSLTSNVITSFSDLKLPSSLTYLGLSWNYIDSFDGMSLPTSLQQLYIGGNMFTSLSGASFPSALSLLYAHNLPLKSLDGATFPSSIEYLSLLDCTLTSLDGVTFPSNLTNLDISGNSITSIPSDLPSGMTQLNAMDNKVTELYNVSLPTAIKTLNLSGNAITTIQGVSFPWALEKLDLGSNSITTFEISRSDYSTFQDLKSFTATVSQSTCSTSGAELVTVNKLSLCVISDDLFAATYGSSTSANSASSSSSSSETTSVATSSGSGSSTVLIVVICLAVVLAVALAALGYRVYQNKRNKGELGDSNQFFSNQLTMANTTHSSGKNDNDTNNSYAFNTIFSNGQVTLMGGTAIESALIKYRVPANEIMLHEPIAKGGFGIVFLATYQDQQVVLKKMLPEKATDDRCLNGFIEEIKLSSTLSHPKVVRFIGVSWSMLSDMAVIMEYMPNGDLDALLKKQHKRKAEHPAEFDWYENSSVLPAKATIALDILEAIVYLHSFPSPIIHRDLKSKNVLLSSSYEAKLSDFGISREWQVDETMTAGIGTMAWIAPEVLRGERYTEMADMYSFGVILSELATCVKPFEGVTNALIVLKVTSEEKPSLGDDCPDDIRDLADRCLSYHASDRPSASVAHYELRTLAKVHTNYDL